MTPKLRAEAIRRYDMSRIQLHKVVSVIQTKLPINHVYTYILYTIRYIKVRLYALFILSSFNNRKTQDYFPHHLIVTKICVSFLLV